MFEACPGLTANTAACSASRTNPLSWLSASRVSDPVKVVSADLETNLLCPGIQAPPPVCGQWIEGPVGNAWLEHANPRVGGGLKACMHSFLRRTDILLNGHNFAYDMAVLCAWDPQELLPLVFEAYETDRITDTQIRQKLIETAAGTREEHTKYSLADCIKRTCDYELDKSDPWRMKYGTLIDVPLSDWDEGAKSYALLDATAQRDLYWEQERIQEIIPGVFKPQFLEARAAFWLHLSSCWGMMTHKPTIDRYYEGVKADLDKDKKTLQETLVKYEGKKGITSAPLVDKLGKKNTKAAAQLMIEACERRGLKVRKTKKGAVQLDEDAIATAGDPLLLAYQRYGSANTLLGKVTRLYKGTVTPLQPRYDSLKETSRTSVSQGEDPKPGEAASAYGSQIQNPPQDQERARAGLVTFRECFVARGHYPVKLPIEKRKVLCPLDFDGAELVTWSQQVIDLGFHSRMAEVLNEGRDPHTELGAILAGVSIEEAYARKKGKRGKVLKDEWKSKWRQCAKPANFGLPGGMGAARFKEAARMLYGVDLDLLGIDPKFVVNAWKEAWPETYWYFKWVNEQLDHTKVINRGKENEEEIEVGRFVDSRSGFIRGEIPYCVLANMPFQHRAACMAKAAGWALTRACYLAPRGHALHGVRIWAFLHDEFIFEIPEVQAQEAAWMLRDIQVNTAKLWVPDVKLTATPALMYHWNKNAELVQATDGRILVWDSEEGIARRAELERETKEAERSAA